MRFVSEFDSRERKTRGLWKRRRWDAARLPFLPAIRRVDERSCVSPSVRVDERRQTSPNFLETPTPTPRKP